MAGKKRARTYQLDEQTIEAIDSLAAKWQTNPSAIINLLLERALHQIETGEWSVRPRPVKFVPTWADEHKEQSR